MDKIAPEIPSKLCCPMSLQPHQQKMPAANPKNLPSSSGAQNKQVYEEMCHLSGFYVASHLFHDFNTISQSPSHHAESPAAKAHIAATSTSGIINTGSALLDNLLTAEQVTVEE